MRILFVLPAPVRVPSGGAAVVYRHASGLAAMGHEVHVVAPSHLGGVGGGMRSLAVKLANRIQGVENRPLYAADGVQTHEVRSPEDIDARNFDSVIATGYQTAPWVHRALEGRPAGYYFIQHDERYLNSLAEKTWALPLTRMTIASWIAELLERHDAPVQAVVPNAIDPAVFSVVEPLDDRPLRVVALYHRLPVKGPDTLVRTLETLKDLVPDVAADVIASRPPLHRLPSWVTRHIRPSQSELRQLYNRAGVCLNTSRLEGWGLVPMEAAACGCAVVSTANQGVSEYLSAERSMLLVDVEDAQGLAEKATWVLTHPHERIRIARAGIEDVARFSWEDSTAQFASVLEARA